MQQFAVYQWSKNINNLNVFTLKNLRNTKSFLQSLLMIYETEALILNRYPYGDTSIICNLFTRDYGRLSVISKGARKLKNINSAILRPLQFIDLNYYYRSKRNIQLLKEATINKHFFKRIITIKIVSSYQIIDIMNQICKIENPNEIIFRLVKRTMKKINLCESDKIILYKIFLNFNYSNILVINQ